MKKIFTLLFIFVCLASAVAQTQSPPLGLIPLPQRVTQGSGHYNLLTNSRITVADGLDEATLVSVRRVANELSVATGQSFEVTTSSNGGIRIEVSTSLPAESYTLNVTTEGIRIVGGDAAGVFYGLQTLKQLLPRAAMAVVYDADAQWQVPVVSIEDTPRFAWRGFMLDEGRHFFGKEEVKKVLDMMATYKMNRFHWHLTEDQGWRIEIKKYPKLTTVGSVRKWTNDWYNNNQPYYTPYGPFFYTQDDIREIVAYAKERHIEILPEVDMPGHFVAALTAYPEFSCTPNARREVWVDGGISRDVLNVANPQAVEFVKDILDELIELFPFQYIHIGGDEAPTNAWQNNAECQALLRSLNSTNYHDLQTHFYRQINTHLQGKEDVSKRRKIIAWNETLNGSTDGLNVTIMAWINADNQAKLAAERGLDVILTPQIPYYINRRQSTLSSEPWTQGHGHETVERVYNYVPASNVSGSLLNHYKGVQANFWTERVNSGKLLEYLMLPRLAAVAEAGWTPQSQRHYNNFVERIRQDTAFYKLKGWDYGKHIMQPETPTLPQVSSSAEKIWHRIISVSTDQNRQGKCIELLQNSSPILSQHSTARAGMLWSNTVASSADAAYNYQWWAFVESPTEKGRYALVCKAMPNGSVRGNATAGNNTGRWTYDENNLHYDFVLGETFENGNTPSVSIRSVHHNGWYVNLAAAGQQYSINLWSNASDSKAGMWSIVPLLHREKQELAQLIQSAQYLVQQPTYENAADAQPGTYSAAEQTLLSQAIATALAQQASATTEEAVESAKSELNTRVSAFKASLVGLVAGGEYRIYSTKYQSHCIGIDNQNFLQVTEDSLSDATAWLCATASAISKVGKSSVILSNKAQNHLHLLAFHEPAKATSTRSSVVLNWDFNRSTWRLSANTTSTTFLFPMPPTAWSNPNKLYKNADIAARLGTEWKIVRIDNRSSISPNISDTQFFTLTNGKVSGIKGAKITITDVNGRAWHANQTLPQGIYIVSDGVRSVKIMVK